MSDIVERLNVYGRSEFGQSVPGFMFVEAATEIARLRAELAEARDKALDEAAWACEAHMSQCLDDRDIQRRWSQIKARNDTYAQAIRALKSPKLPIL